MSKDWLVKERSISRATAKGLKENGKYIILNNQIDMQKTDC